jgi:RNA polymerase primary sigma factor
MINRIPPTATPAALNRPPLTDEADRDLSHGVFAPLAPEADALTRYLDQAARWPRLEAADEFRLGHLIKSGRRPDGTLTPEAQAAHDTLVNCNLRLSHHAASKLRVPREELMELISAGNVALLAAAGDFNADLGHRFSTYAYWGIRSAIFRELNFLRRTVRLPRNLHEQLARLRKVEEATRQALGRAPTDIELAAALACSPEKLTELQCYAYHGQSLDAPLSAENETTLGDSLADSEATTPATAAERADQQDALNEVLAQLTPRELTVIRRRHGLDGAEETLDAIGRDERVSRERIRQIEAVAFRKLREGIRR